MSPPPRWTSTWLILQVFTWVAPAFAGTNAGGHAFLSWDRAGRDTLLSKAPAAPFPLYLQLRGVSDVRALAAKVDWTTRTSDASPCYAVLSSSAPDATCAPDSLRGWAFDRHPGRDFGGDTTYTWTIAFDPADPARGCVEYRVSAAACADTAHAEFVISSVMVMDALDRIDTLAVTGGARIVPRVVHLAIERAWPKDVPFGQAADLRIKGRGFEPGSRVYLQRGGQRIEADRVSVMDSTEILARVESPFATGGSVDLIVEHPVGVEASLPTGLQAAGGSQIAFFRPTNDDFAFTQIDLHATSDTSHVIPISLPQWPSWPKSPPDVLVVKAPADTAALMRSSPYNGIGLWSASDGTTSRIQFHLSPPIYATSLAMLATSGWTFKDDVGNWADRGKPILRVKLTYADGDTAVSLLEVGTHVRNWTSGSLTCFGVPHFFYDLLPTGSLVRPLLPAGNYNYDLQEIPLPPGRRSKRLAAVEITAQPILRDSCRSYSGTSGIFGLAVWPEFKVTDAEGDTVVRCSQDTNQSHGGYLFGSVAVGTRRTTNQTACQVASAAMNYSFLGVPCSVDSLNVFLRRNNGYLPENVAFISWVSTNGDTIEFKGPAQSDRDNWKETDTFLVERGNRAHPVATFAVLPGEPRRAVIATRHDLSSTVAVGDTGRVYWNMIPTKADRFTLDTGGQPRLRTVELPGSPGLAAKVESLLVRGHPVQVHTHGHMVVADGWVPSFRPDTTARGTYAIQDPLNRRNYRRLIEGKYRNEFKLARYVVPVGEGQGPSRLAGATGAEHEYGLSILVSHANNVTITDPTGRSIARDPTTGLYSSTIPEAWVIDDIVADHDVDDELDGPPVMHQFHLPAAVDGHYTVRVDSEGGMSLSVAAFDTSGVVAATAAMDTSETPGGSSYDVVYSASTPWVAVSWLGPVAAEGHRSIGSRFRVLKNPTSGPVQFELHLPEHVDGERLDLFDISGRRVATLDIGQDGSGGSVIAWDWRGAGCRAGVYFACLRSGAHGVLRFAVLR